jgi:hypothetical protein
VTVFFKDFHVAVCPARQILVTLAMTTSYSEYIIYGNNFIPLPVRHYATYAVKKKFH